MIRSIISSCQGNNYMENIRFMWIVDKTHFKVIYNPGATPSISNLRLLDHVGNEVLLKSIKPGILREYQILNLETVEPIDQTKNYYIPQNQNKIFGYYTKEMLNQYFTTDLPLGALYDFERTHFRFWSPSATEVNIIFYDYFYPSNILAKRKMKRQEQGCWFYTLHQNEINWTDLHNLPYLYEVTAHDKTNLVLDPYSKSITAHEFSYIKETPLPRSVVMDMNRLNPHYYHESQTYNSAILTKPMEFIGIEAHIRDYTIDADSPVDQGLKGTYLGFSQLADYFKDLGITHVQLMPLHSFYTVNEKDRTFQGKHRSSDKINYNWGYDPLNFFAPTGWYATDVDNPEVRVKELKHMTHTFHQKGIGLVLDVVYNHIYNQNILLNASPDGYIRRNFAGDISYTTGAGPSLESRIHMVRRLFIDSLKFYVQEYHFNGFRFDLMSFMDHETILAIRQALGPDIILYGEAWNFTDLPWEQAVTKFNYPKGIALGMFNDSSRDAYTGYHDSRGIIQGNFNENLRARSGILGGPRYYNADYNGDGRDDILMGNDPYHYFADEPVNCLNYLTIHDGFTLWDKINLSVAGTFEYKKQLCKQAMTLLMTSQGRVIIHGGMEMGRTKPMMPNDPNPDRAFSSQNAFDFEGFYKFHENSYRSGDRTNMIRWARKKQFQDVFDHLKKLIQIRRETHFFRLDNSIMINKHLKIYQNLRPDEGHHFESFADMSYLKIVFTHGPSNKRLYLTGEVHPIKKDKNPKEGNLYIDFDQHGRGEITFNRNQILNFDTMAWGADQDLQFKLVRTPGQWDFLEYAYTNTGHNAISSLAVGADQTVHINLSQKDDMAVISYLKDPDILIYGVDIDEGRAIVLHNFSSVKKEQYCPLFFGKDSQFEDLLTGHLHLCPVQLYPHQSLILRQI